MAGQIGSSQESKLLQEILKEINKLIKIAGNKTP